MKKTHEFVLLANRTPLWQCAFLMLAVANFSPQPFALAKASGAFGSAHASCFAGLRLAAKCKQEAKCATRAAIVCEKLHAAKPRTLLSLCSRGIRSSSKDTHSFPPQSNQATRLAAKARARAGPIHWHFTSHYPALQKQLRQIFNPRLAAESQAKIINNNVVIIILVTLASFNELLGCCRPA